MLATIRRVVACLVLLAFVVSFIPLWGVEGRAAWHWVERVQFVPALLSSICGMGWAWLVLGALLVLTLVFGRVFCSWLCPLGMLQDFANRAALPFRKTKIRRFAPNHPRLRAVVALVAFAGLAAGSVGLLTWLDPYSIAARGMAALLAPLLTSIASALGADLPSPDWLRYAGTLGMAVAAFGLALPLGLAVWRGRLYCNTLCPVGAVLGLLARFAPCTPHIDKELCGRCAACMKACKAQAIDVKNMRVDATRCVACYNCLGACGRGAMQLAPEFARERETEAAAQPAAVADVAAALPAAGPASPSRRAFLSAGVMSLAAAALPEMPRPAPSSNPAEVGTNETAAAVPPGAQSVERLLSRCTSCGLCIANCPTGVLRASFLDNGPGFMRPMLRYGSASCDPNCATCSQACPTGALLPLSLAEKRHTQIGLAQYTQKYCLVWANGHICGKCVTELSCPTGALVAQEVQRPTVDAEKCRGCRRCTRVCPAGAITRVEVEGRERPLAVIDYSKCIGCGACAAACRPKAIGLTTLVAPRLAAPEKCIGCGACEQVCPTRLGRALRVIPRAVHLRTPQE